MDLKELVRKSVAAGLEDVAAHAATAEKQATGFTRPCRMFPRLQSAQSDDEPDR